MTKCAYCSYEPVIAEQCPNCGKLDPFGVTGELADCMRREEETASAEWLRQRLIEQRRLAGSKGYAIAGEGLARKLREEETMTEIELRFRILEERNVMIKQRVENLKRLRASYEDALHAKLKARQDEAEDGERLVYEHSGTGFAVTTHRVVRRGSDICDPQNSYAGFQSEGFFKGQCLVIVESTKGSPFRLPNVKRGAHYAATVGPLRLTEELARGLGYVAYLGPSGLSRAEAKEVCSGLNSAFKQVFDYWERQRTQQRAQQHSGITSLKKL